MNTTPQTTSATSISLTDRQLLRRFLQDDDEQAFNNIVQRYHGLVMSVCGRIVDNQSDAEDAFQATFLALARRPRSIRRAESLSSWLYTVAWRTSWRLVKQRRKQPVDTLPQEPAHSDPGPLEQIADAQSLLVLDEEMNALPARYRDVLVASYFSGQTSQQIADELHVSRGTIDGRIKRGRNLLRVRLARRGVSVGAIGIAVSLIAPAAKAASPELLASTTDLGAQLLSGNTPTEIDLSNLDPLSVTESVMTTSKILLTSTLCVAGIAGACGLAMSGDNNLDGPPTLASAQVGSGEGSVTTGSVAPAVVISASSSPANDQASLATIPDTAVTEPADAQKIHFRGWREYLAPQERWLYEVLDQPTPLLDFPGEASLGEILGTIVQHVNDQPHPDNFRMTLWPDREELEIEGIEDLADVRVSGIEMEGMPIRTALKLIFERTSDPRLTWVIRDKVFKITTFDKANSNESLETRMYPVGHLLAVRTPVIRKPVPSGTQPQEKNANSAGQGFFSVDDADYAISRQFDDGKAGLDRQQAAETLVQLLRNMTAPPALWQAVDNTGGKMELFGDTLIVLQTPQTHHKIVSLLEQLTEIQTGLSTSRTSMQPGPHE